MEQFVVNEACFAYKVKLLQDGTQLELWTTSQAYPDSQEGEFPLSASLAEIEQATTHQVS